MAPLNSVCSFALGAFPPGYGLNETALALALAPCSDFGPVSQRTAAVRELVVLVLRQTCVARQAGTRPGFLSSVQPITGADACVGGDGTLRPGPGASPLGVCELCDS